MKQLKLRIHPDGKIEAEPNGVKGKACLSYIAILEKLTGAVTVDSAFTPEYRESEELLVNTLEVEVNA
jgi:hypothetical protein